MADEPAGKPIVIDWKQLAVYLALAVGLFLIAYELIERLAEAWQVENVRGGRHSVFGVFALLVSLPLTRLVVKWLAFMPEPPKR